MPAFVVVVVAILVGLGQPPVLAATASTRQHAATTGTNSVSDPPLQGATQNVRAHVIPVAGRAMREERQSAAIRGEHWPWSTGFAAEAGGARFAVSSAGEATMSLRAGSQSLEVTEHAALRLTQRGISIDQADAALSQQPFQYFYKGGWQAGYYDPASRVFLGSVDGRITTVINNVKQNYIDNLMAASP